MAVRVQHRVKAVNAFPHCLFAEVRPAVDDNAMSFPLDHHRGPGAPVPRIGRAADFAIASNAWARPSK